MALETPGVRFRERRLTTPRGTAAVWLQKHAGRIEFHTVRSNGGGTSNWAKCSNSECLGEAVSTGVCFAHATPDQRKAYIARQQTTRSAISLRGVVADEAVLRDAFGATAIKGGLISHAVSLAGAEINAQLRFEDVEFASQIEFGGALVTASFSFLRCHFRQDMHGSFAFFNAGPPSWTECTFDRGLRLDYAHAERVSIGLERCTIRGDVHAEGISGALLMRKTVVAGNVMLANASTTLIAMDEAELAGSVDLADAELQGWHAKDASFASAFQIGPAKVKHCYLNRATFGARVRVDLTSSELVLDGTMFQAGGTIMVEEASVSLEQVSVGRHLLITGTGGEEHIPSIRSLRDADAGSMTFSRVSMKRCLFLGAHNLGELTLEPSVELESTPRPFHVRRQCIMDEVVWRASRPGFLSKPWKALVDESKPSKTKPERHATVPTPGQVAAVYRDLRRGRESRADQPGAADFYYGEMEMRRHDSTTLPADRLVVAAYWITSGYGLRASRSLVLLLATLVIAVVLLRQFGYASGPSDTMTAALFALRAVLPGLRTTDAELTQLGEGVEITVAFIGPVLLALFFLALRGRVKR